MLLYSIFYDRRKSHKHNLCSISFEFMRLSKRSFAKIKHLDSSRYFEFQILSTIIKDFFQNRYWAINIWCWRKRYNILLNSSYQVQWNDTERVLLSKLISLIKWCCFLNQFTKVTLRTLILFFGEINSDACVKSFVRIYLSEQQN